VDEFFKDNIEFLITLGSTIVAVILGIIGIQRYFHKQKLERLEETHKLELERLTSQHKQEIAEKPLIQEEKIVYVKYVYIRRESESPVYRKFVKRIEEEINVHSEYRYYRLNKFSTKNNSITIRDRSSGVVDMNIVFPWRDLIFTDKPSKKIKELISQELSNSDTYFTVTTYYNGFKEGNEDIGMKMEMDTQSARLIADFSSIVGLEKLFRKEPNVYKIKQDGDKIKISGLEEINNGIYHIHINNLKKDEVIILDFHVNWDYLNDD
jgi:hypothetical protein